MELYLVKHPDFRRNEDYSTYCKYMLKRIDFWCVLERGRGSGCVRGESVTFSQRENIVTCVPKCMSSSIVRICWISALLYVVKERVESLVYWFIFYNVPIILNHWVLCIEYLHTNSHAFSFCISDIFNVNKHTCFMIK